MSASGEPDPALRVIGIISKCLANICDDCVESMHYASTREWNLNASARCKLLKDLLSRLHWLLGAYNAQGWKTSGAHIPPTEVHKQHQSHLKRDQEERQGHREHINHQQ